MKFIFKVIEINEVHVVIALTEDEARSYMLNKNQTWDIKLIGIALGEQASGYVA